MVDIETLTPGTKLRLSDRARAPGQDDRCAYVGPSIRGNGLVVVEWTHQPTYAPAIYPSSELKRDER